jgi:hypothetical protein
VIGGRRAKHALCYSCNLSDKLNTVVSASWIGTSVQSIAIFSSSTGCSITIHSTDNPRLVTNVPNMPKEQQKRATRQQPISCRSCRSRKLRCDRVFPCSNCAARGVACELENAVRPPAAPAAPAARSLDTELLERVRKLERLAESQQVRQNEIVTPPHPSQAAPWGSTVAPRAPSPEIESLNSDIAYLESIYSDSERLGSLLTAPLTAITN